MRAPVFPSIDDIYCTEIKKKKTHKEEQVMTFISCIVNVKKYQKYQLQKYQLNDQMNS